VPQALAPSLPLALCLALAACAAPSSPPAPRYVPLAEAGALLPHSSPECLAKKLRPGEPFPASAIPAAALAARQSGWVAVRYDVVGGVAQNLVVAASSPAGLYDAAALQHAARYRDPGKTTVAGCVMTVDVKF
jgi:outer membrane biosynthesis protein TonB